ncbi:MAG: sugar phosphate isomerase/epimerase [Planctomycetes bacterium]|nr:sugar phosphate isomerase/epimerase [Planctomycetota bacterium]
MHIDFRMSLWNYIHYANCPPLEGAIAEIRALGFGAELWDQWRNETGLFSPAQRDRMKALVEDMNVSMHTIMPRGRAMTWEENVEQIDTAAYVGADTIVAHVCSTGVGESDPDYGLMRDVVNYAEDKGVTLAIENGDAHAIGRALPEVPNLKTCLDTGHVYNDGFTMPEVLGIMGDRIVHLHLQDRLPHFDHYIPGTGIIPGGDWKLLFTHLKRIDFTGAGVFELRPRRPDVSAKEGRSFVESMIERI